MSMHWAQTNAELSAVLCCDEIGRGIFVLNRNWLFGNGIDYNAVWYVCACVHISHPSGELPDTMTNFWIIYTHIICASFYTANSIATWANNRGKERWRKTMERCCWWWWLWRPNENDGDDHYLHSYYPYMSVIWSGSAGSSSNQIEYCWFRQKLTFLEILHSHTLIRWNDEVVKWKEASKTERI